MNDVAHRLNTNYKLDRNVSCVKYKPQYVVVVGILLKVRKNYNCKIEVFRHRV